MTTHWTLCKICQLPVKVSWPVLFLVVFLLINSWIGLHGSPLVGVGEAVVFLLCLLARAMAQRFVAGFYHKKPNCICLQMSSLPLASEPEKPTEELAMAAAGPVATIALYVVSMVLFIALSIVSTLELPPVAMAIVNTLWTICSFSVVIGQFLLLFNLLPIRPMDGERVLRSLLQLMGVKPRWTRIIRGLCVFGIVALIGASLAFIMVVYRHLSAMYVLFAVVIYSVAQTIEAERRRAAGEEATGLMTQWTLFRTQRVTVRVSLLTILLALYFLFRYVPFGWENIRYSVVEVGFFLLAVAVHELAQFGLASAFGGAPKSFALQLFSGGAQSDCPTLKPWQQCLIALSGPLVSFLLSGLFFALAFGYLILAQTVLPDSVVRMTRPTFDFLNFASMASFAIGALNLLPALPTDMGRLLRSLLRMEWMNGLHGVASVIVSLLAFGTATLLASVSIQTMLGYELIPPELVYWSETLCYLVYGPGALSLIVIAAMIACAAVAQFKIPRPE